MRAFRFGPALALAATVALGGCTAWPGGDGPGYDELAVDRTQADLLTREYDRQLDHELAAMVAAAEISPDGELFFTRALGDPRFLDPNSGRYWQVSGEGQGVFASRSLWDRRLEVSGRKARAEPLYYNSDQFPDEPLRVVERTIRLSGSDIEWRFVVGRARNELD